MGLFALVAHAAWCFKELATKLSLTSRVICIRAVTHVKEVMNHLGPDF